MKQEPFAIHIEVAEYNGLLKPCFKTYPFRTFHTEEEAIDYAIALAEKHTRLYDSPSKERNTVTTEMLTATNYIIEETNPSKIDPDATITVEVGMRCPRCKTTLKPLDHSESQKCPSCKLKIQRFGNGLECTT